MNDAIVNPSYEYKGYIAENFVQQEFAAIAIEPSYSWNNARAEIEFIVSTWAAHKSKITPILYYQMQATKND